MVISFVMLYFLFCLLYQMKKGCKLTLLSLYLKSSQICKLEFPANTCLCGGLLHTRYREEKIRTVLTPTGLFLFNDVIDSLTLQEVSMSGQQFIWANNYEKLDKVLMNTEWELKFPMRTVRALERIDTL